MATAFCYLLFINSCLLQWSGVFALTPVVYTDKIPSSSQCGQDDSFVENQELMETLDTIHQQLPLPGCNPPLTCVDVIRCKTTAPSGYYHIKAANGSALQVYCDMEGANCGGEGGWMRVAILNANSLSNPCPSGFQLGTHNNNRFCRDSNSVCRMSLNTDRNIW